MEIIASVVDAVAIPVIGNGDVRSIADAEAMVAATRCAAVMIGRGAFGAPWVFRGFEETPACRAARIIRRHDELIEALLPPRTAQIQLKKHLAWYVHGFPNAAPFREELFRAQETSEVRGGLPGAPGDDAALLRGLERRRPVRARHAP